MATFPGRRAAGARQFPRCAGAGAPPGALNLDLLKIKVGHTGYVIIAGRLLYIPNVLVCAAAGRARHLIVWRTRLRSDASQRSTRTATTRGLS